jgi:hypothetical protein
MKRKLITILAALLAAGVILSITLTGCKKMAIGLIKFFLAPPATFATSWDTTHNPRFAGAELTGNWDALFAPGETPNAAENHTLLSLNIRLPNSGENGDYVISMASMTDIPAYVWDGWLLIKIPATNEGAAEAWRLAPVVMSGGNRLDMMMGTYERGDESGVAILTSADSPVTAPWLGNPAFFLPDTAAPKDSPSIDDFTGQWHGRMGSERYSSPASPWYVWYTESEVIPLSKNLAIAFAVLDPEEHTDLTDEGHLVYLLGIDGDGSVYALTPIRGVWEQRIKLEITESNGGTLNGIADSSANRMWGDALDETAHFKMIFRISRDKEEKDIWTPAHNSGQLGTAEAVVMIR